MWVRWVGAQHGGAARRGCLPACARPSPSPSLTPPPEKDNCPFFVPNKRYVLELGHPETSALVMEGLAGHYGELSTQKFRCAAAHCGRGRCTGWRSELGSGAMRVCVHACVLPHTSQSIAARSSNVVEKCLKLGGAGLDEQRNGVVRELMDSPNLGRLLQVGAILLLL